MSFTQDFQHRAILPSSVKVVPKVNTVFRTPTIIKRTPAFTSTDNTGTHDLSLFTAQAPRGSGPTDPWINLDGRLNAPIVDTAQHPTLVNQFGPTNSRVRWPFSSNYQPPWMIAGVDYGIGCPPSQTLTAASAYPWPTGSSYSSGVVFFDTGFNGGTITGVDFGNGNIQINGGAKGNLTLNNCDGIGNGNGWFIKTVVNPDPSFSLTVKNSTLNGGGAAGQNQFAQLLTYCPLTVLYCWIKNCAQGIHCLGPTNVVKYTVIEQVSWDVRDHANGIYIEPSTNGVFNFNTFWTGASQNAGVPIGLGLPLSFQAGNDSGVVWTNIDQSYNTMVSDLPGGVSAMVGFLCDNTGTIQNITTYNNYMGSFNGFGGSGAVGAFQMGSGSPWGNGASGANTILFGNKNVDMFLGTTISPPSGFN